MFDPKPTKYPFPRFTDRHYLVVKKDNGLVFDKDYPYIDRSPIFRFKQFLVRILLYILVFPIATVRLGLKINGRDKIRKNKEELKKGVISCANHVHLWDYIAVMKAIRPHRPNLLAWDKNIRGENGKLMRMVGGIPIPVGDVHALGAFVQTIDDLLDRGGWLHAYAEGSMWEYYAPVRPFKSGIGYFAVDCGKPILPMAFSYREPGFIRKKIFKQTALFTLNVGDLIYPDETLDKKERKTDIVKRTHEAVCSLAGIDPDKNLYPPIFNNTERIDYYEIPLAEPLEEKSEAKSV